MIVSSHVVQEHFEFNDIGDQVWEAVQGWYCDAEYFDAVITCKDGVDVRAHKLVLAALSKYFKAAFFGPVNKNAHGLVTTHLDFLSSSVQFYIDCLYQRHDEEDFDIDILDFSALCDYVGESCFHRIGLQIAAQKLTTQNAFSELKEIVSATSGPIPNWLPTVTHFINVSLEDKSMDITELSVYEPSPLSLISLLSSVSASVCSNSVTLELIRLLTNQDLYYTSQELEMIVPNILRLVNENLNGPTDIILVQQLVEKLNDRCVQPGSINSLLNEHLLTSNLSFSSDEGILLQIPCHRAALDYIFFSKKMELSDGDFELGRFTSSLMNVSSDLFRNSKGNMHGLRLRFFVWKMFICIVFVDILVGIRVFKYNWISSEWVPLAIVEIELAYNFEIQSCSATKNNMLSLLLLEKVEGISQRRPLLYIVELGKSNPGVVLKSFHRRHAGMKIVSHLGRQLAFVTPHSYIDVTELSEDSKEIVITDPIGTTSLGILLSFQNTILHFHNDVQNQGFFLDELKLKKSTSEWERLTRKLSDRLQLVDAFVASGDVFVIYKKMEDIAEPYTNDITPNDDEDDLSDFFNSDVESEPEYVDNKREIVYLKKCSYREAESGNYELTFSEDDKEIGPIYCSKDTERIVVKRCVFPLDVLPYM